MVTLNGIEVDPFNEIILNPGTNLLCCCQVSIWSNEMEILIETEEDITFSALSILGEENLEWAIYQIPSATIAYPWHEAASGITGEAQKIGEFAPEVIDILKKTSTKELNKEEKKKFIPAIKREPSIFHTVTTQSFYKVSGGFTDSMIEKGNPRLEGNTECTMPLINARNMLHEHIDACMVIPQKERDVHFILDFENEQVGYVQISLEAPEGTIVDVQCFELIDGGGISWMPNYNGFRYVCSEGKQTFTSHNRRGFRYISVTVRSFTRPIFIQSICCMRTTYPIDKVGGFECSDPLLNQVYQMSENTAALCMLDTYVDCPGHEQHFWVGDARITALINLITYGGYDLNQRCIRLVGQSLCPKWVKAYYPEDERYTKGHYLPIAAFPNYPEGGLPMWTFQWILQCYEHFMHGGNITDLMENFGYVSETLSRFSYMTNERNLFDMWGAWNLIEWGNNDLSPYGEVTANNVLLVSCFRAAALMAEYLGQEDKHREYEAEAEKRISAINKYCWNNEAKAYVDTIRDTWAYNRYYEFCVAKGIKPDSWERYSGYERVSEQSNTLAILYDCVPIERLDNVKEILERVRNGNYVYGAPAGRSSGKPTQKEAPDGIVAIGSPFFLFFSLGALFKTGKSNLALEVMRRDWGKMAALGTKTCWETFMMKDNYWTRSVCHAWSAAPAVYLPTQILGIRPVEPGFRKFVVEPHMGELNWIKGAVATPYGPIFVTIERMTNGTIDVQCLAPVECTRIK